MRRLRGEQALWLLWALQLTYCLSYIPVPWMKATCGARALTLPLRLLKTKSVAPAACLALSCARSARVSEQRGRRGRRRLMGCGCVETQTEEKRRGEGGQGREGHMTQMTASGCRTRCNHADPRHLLWETGVQAILCFLCL